MFQEESEPKLVDLKFKAYSGEDIERIMDLAEVYPEMDASILWYLGIGTMMIVGVLTASAKNATIVRSTNGQARFHNGVTSVVLQKEPYAEYVSVTITTTDQKIVKRWENRCATGRVPILVGGSIS